MAEIKEVPLSGWEEFKAAFAQHLFGEEPFRRDVYIFRGHSDAKWRLTPTFDRRFQDLPKTKVRFDIGRDLYDEFLNELRRLDISKDVLDDERIILPLAQHYGMPTRLLDWTASPYIAAFFAYNSNFIRKDDDNVAIFALDARSPIWAETFGIEIITPKPFGNIRLRNQSGKFTLSRTPFDTLEAYIEYFPEDTVETPPLYKFILPASDSMRALADLDAMGINHSTLFPDIEGSVQVAVFRTVLKHGVMLR